MSECKQHGGDVTNCPHWQNGCCNECEGTNKPMKYKTRITKLTVMPENDPIWSEMATHIQIEDEAAGEYLTIQQCYDHSKDGTIRIDPAEWPAIQAAVNRMIEEIEKHRNE